MNAVRLFPVVLSLLLLGAHFYRAGQLPLVALCLALPCLLFLRRTWVPPVIQTALVLGALEWLRTLFSFAQVRIHLGMPWGRLAAILGAVALLTAASALVFRHRRLRARYDEVPAPDRTES